MPFRYLMDENLSPAYRRGLQRRDPSITVWEVGSPGAPPRGSADPEILRWCEEKGFILVTDNRHSMPVHLAEHLADGRHVPGILTIRRRATMGHVLDALAVIAGASEPREYTDRLVYIPFE